MATSEEKQETIDALKGERYYRVMISGYGGEAAYMSISKEAHDFWKPILDEHGDSDLVAYMAADDDEEPDYDEIEAVPEEAQFLHDKDDDNYKRPWYESHTEYEHSYGGAYDSSYITVDEVENDDYNASVICEIIDRESVSDFVNKIGDETDWEIELNESQELYAGNDIKYIAQMYSSEKGCFFDGIIETIGEFDPKKLKFYLGEYDNGEETINSIEYNGVEIDNQGGDTNGKGYYASVWQNS